MDKVLVITDLHIRPPGESIIGLDPSARLDAVLDHALAAHADASALIVMGDLTHDGLPVEYDRLRACLDRVPMPILPMLGNHDRRDVFLAAFPDAPRTPEGHVQAVMDLPHHRIITLDTLDGPPYPDDHHSGLLCVARMAWLANALEGAQGRMPLVFLHHPPFPMGMPGVDAIALADPEEFLDLLAQYPGSHLFCGHVHRTASGSLRGLPWTLFKSPCHQSPLDLWSEDGSPPVDEPGAYGVLLLRPGGVIAHSQDVGLHGAVGADSDR